MSKSCEQLLAAQLGAPAVLLTTSCTDALEMAALLLKVGSGDEVILPSFTFSSTATAFTLRGATPVFADIRADTMNLDEARLEELITARTKAVVVVHYAGVACEMNRIMEICAGYQIPVVEDNAHGLYGRYCHQSLGTFGALATQSFHETKNLTCGEGGALIINDGGLLARAEILREKGTDRSRFFRGEVDKYTWVDEGSSYLPSEITAAMLLAQLEDADAIQKKREHLWESYRRAVQSWATDLDVQLPTVPEGCEQAFHMFYLVLKDNEMREALRHHLLAAGVLAVTHYVPLHSSPYGRSVGRGSCPVASDVSERLLRLPFYTDMTDEELSLVMDAVHQFT
jgi:dTDP-4-amino-4,6-dideoxygalactose transaminase